MNDHKRVNKLEHEIYNPVKIANYLIGVISLISGTIGLIDFIRQHTAPLIVNYEFQTVVLPDADSPKIKNAAELGGFLDYLPISGQLNPITGLSTITIENRKNLVSKNIRLRLLNVDRFLYVTGYENYPEQKLLSKDLKVDLSTSTKIADITGIPDMLPHQEIELFIWADHVNFGLTPIELTSDQGSAKISTSSNVRGPARIFAYLMTWLVSAFLILIFWFLIEILIDRIRKK